MKIISDNKIPYLKGALEPFAQVVYKPGAEVTRQDVKEAQAVITRTRTPCKAELLQDSGVKFIATATIGFDHIDTEFCRQAGIEWTNAPGCNSESVNQYIASLLVSLASKHGFQLQNKTLGVIGIGNVGSKVAHFAQTIGMQVLQNDPPRQSKEGGNQFVGLDELLQKADIISLHVPLERQGKMPTFHMVNDAFLQRTKPGCIIINSSRGEVVNGDALKQALKDQRLGGAALDVWEHEPEIDQELLGLLDFATPHIAGYSKDGKARGTSMSVQAISRFFGLGIDDWQPTGLPQPKHPVISLDAAALSPAALLEQAVLATYNIADDDSTLRASVATFEAQRGDYPDRREFPAHRLVLKNATQQQIHMYRQLGFQVA